MALLVTGRIALTGGGGGDEAVGCFEFTACIMKPMVMKIRSPNNKRRCATCCDDDDDAIAFVLLSVSFMIYDICLRRLMDGRYTYSVQGLLPVYFMYVANASQCVRHWKHLMIGHGAIQESILESNRLFFLAAEENVRGLFLFRRASRHHASH